MKVNIRLYFGIQNGLHSPILAVKKNYVTIHFNN